MPTDADIYATRSWLKNALLQPAPRAAYRRLLAQGWTDAIRTLHPDERIYTFWDYMRNRWPRDAGLRIDHLLLSASVQAAPERRRRRSRGARLGARQRPRAGLDRARAAPAFALIASLPRQPEPSARASRPRNNASSASASSGLTK